MANIVTSHDHSSKVSESANLGFIILISSVAAIGGLLFGYDCSCINGAVKAIQEAFHSGEVNSGFNAASALLGCAAGAFLAGGIADKFGRRAAMFAAAILFGVGALGAGAANSSSMFITFRLIGGFAVGAASVIAPAYISEVAPAAYRGRLASLQQLGIVTGILLSFLANYYLANAAEGHTASGTLWMGYAAWKWMFWAQLIPSGIFFFGLFTIPESPRYLVAAGRDEQAREILAKTSHPNNAAEKVAEIRATLAVDHRPSMKDLFDKVKGGVHPIVWVGIIIAALQQFVGINVIFYYGELLWQGAGFSEADSLKINVIGGAINVLSTFVAIALVDKWGRKPLLIAGSVGMTVTLGIMAYLFATHVGADGVPHLGKAGFTALIAANAYIVAFGISWGPIVWVMLGEMFPNQFRGAALAVSGLSQWISNFLITLSFPYLLKHIGLGGAYGIYAFFALISIFIVMAIVKETKGRTLEQM